MELGHIASLSQFLRTLRIDNKLVPTPGQRIGGGSIEDTVTKDPLWTARSLVIPPDHVVGVHRDCLASEARSTLTDSRQDSLEGLKEQLGLEPEHTQDVIKETHSSAWRAVLEEGRVQDHILVAGTVKPHRASR